jgi:hypothetical protein
VPVQQWCQGRFDGGHKIKSKIGSSSKGKSTEVDTKFIITYKECKFSSARLKAKSSKVKIDFSYISRKKVQTELEFWILKRENFHDSTVVSAHVYDDVRGWNTNPYLGASIFF